MERREHSYPWRQGYKAWQEASLRVRLNHAELMSPYDREHQPLCHDSWCSGWGYAQDEADGSFS